MEECNKAPLQRMNTFVSTRESEPVALCVPDGPPSLPPSFLSLYSDLFVNVPNSHLLLLLLSLSCPAPPPHDRRCRSCPRGCLPFPPAGVPTLWFGHFQDVLRYVHTAVAIQLVS